MKNTIKKALISLSFAFAVSAAALGANALVAKADGETIHSAFSTFALQNGASVRLVNTEYEEDENQYGYSYVMEMSTEQYNAVMSQDSNFTNVRFGMLIGPEAYFDAHPFNNQDNIDAYYSLNKEVEGKAFLYDIPSTGFVGDENKVYYRASITEIKDFVRDMRGVAYVQYIYEGTPYKFFFTDESNMRCAVEVADLTIDLLDEEKDAAYINTLKSTYINKIDWTVEKQDAGTRSQQWFQGWGVFEGAPAHNKSWATKYNNNRYVNSKYTTTYAYEKAGKESVPYLGWGGYVNEQVALEGTWTITGRTNCEFIPEEVVSYTYTLTLGQIGGPSASMPTVNGNTLSGASVGGLLWDESLGMCTQVDNWTVKAGHAKKATSDFIVDVDLIGSTTSEFRLYTSDSTWIAFVAKDGGNIAGNDGIYFYTDGANAGGSSWHTEFRVNGNANVFTNPNARGLGALKLRIVNYQSNLYLCSNTYWDGSAVATAENYSVIAALPGNATNPVAQNGLKVAGVNSYQYFRESVNEIYTAATANEFALVSYSTNSSLRINMVLEDNDAAVASFMGNVNMGEGIAVVNGKTLFSNNGQYWTKDASGVWSQSTADGNAYKIVDKATGDFMATMKINSGSSQANMRFWYGDGTFVEVMSPSNNELFFTANGKWASESEIGADTSVFHNEDIGSVGDGWLDVMIVKYNGTFSIYICEYLDGEGNAATYENWTLMYSLTSAGVETYGTGFSRSWSNGWGNVQNGIKGLLSSNEVAVALHCRSGLGQYKLNIVDDDAAVAAFDASDKAVATYAKA